MIPESTPSVCFRCKKCKACFLTTQDINRHLYKENHYIKRSSGSSSSNINTMSSVTSSNGSSSDNNTMSSETSSDGSGSSSGAVNVSEQEQKEIDVGELTSTEIKKTNGDNLTTTEIKQTNGDDLISTEVKKTNGGNLTFYEVKEANGKDMTSTEIAASTPNGTSPAKVGIESTPVLLNTLRNGQAHSKSSSQISKEDQTLKAKTRKRKRTSDALMAAAATNLDETNRRLRSRDSKGEPSQAPNPRRVRSNSKSISPNTKQHQMPKIKRKRSTCDVVMAAAANNLDETNHRLRSRDSKGEPSQTPNHRQVRVRSNSKSISPKAISHQIPKIKRGKRKSTDTVIAAAANNLDETNSRLRSRESKGESSQTPNHRQVRSNSKLISPNTKQHQIPKIKRRKYSSCDEVIAAAATNLSERNIRLRSRESKGGPDQKPKSPTPDHKPKSTTLHQKPKSPIPDQKLKSKSPTPDQPKSFVFFVH